MHVNEAWVYTYDSQVRGWMEIWKGEGKFLGYNKALQKLQQIRRLSTEASPPSSTIVPSSELNVEATFILQQLKASLFESDFLHALEIEEGLARDIFKFLESLALQDLLASMVKYFVKFEAFFTQFVKDLNLRQNVDLQIKTKLNEVMFEWDSSEACEQKLNKFEHKKEERLRQRQAFDQQISDYQAQVAELNRKIANVEA